MVGAFVFGIVIGNISEVIRNSVRGCPHFLMRVCYPNHFPKIPKGSVFVLRIEVCSCEWRFVIIAWLRPVHCSRCRT